MVSVALEGHRRRIHAVAAVRGELLGPRLQHDRPRLLPVRWHGLAAGGALRPAHHHVLLALTAQQVEREDEVLQREGFETRLMDEGRSEEGEKVEHVEDSHEPI